MADTAFKRANLDNKTVRRILAAALELWTREGYHGASLKEIADAAGVAKSLLHYHFASKEHLLAELQAVYFRKVSAEVRERIARRKPSVEGALAVMDEVFEIVIESAQQFPFALEIWRAAQQSPAVRERLEAFEREINRLFREGVNAALGPFTSRLRIPPDRMADLLQVAFGGFELRLFLHPDVKKLRRTYEDFKLLVTLGAIEQGG
jgi:AcrR family transcriptional regulator